MQILCVVSEYLYKLSLPESLRQRLAKRKSIKRKCGRKILVEGLNSGNLQCEFN